MGARGVLLASMIALAACGGSPSAADAGAASPTDAQQAPDVAAADAGAEAATDAATDGEPACPPGCDDLGHAQVGCANPSAQRVCACRSDAGASPPGSGCLPSGLSTAAPYAYAVCCP